MKVNGLKMQATVQQAKAMLAKEKNISPALKATLDLLLVLIETFMERFSLNSKNSHKPPSTDNHSNKKRKKPTHRKPGGQPGREGKQLKPVANPDKIKSLNVDKRSLPKGDYHEMGYEARQVFDFKIKCMVTEYRAQILENASGKSYVAKFPDKVTRPAQYGERLKAQAVYLSQYQLLPYQRVQDYFNEQVNVPLSTGSLFNFNQQAYDLLADFEQIAKDKLANSELNHADETGVNINGKRYWLHITCNDKWTHFYPHSKRGSEATQAIGILPRFSGVLVHDYWKSYYQYDCQHALCNAHILRELEWSATEDKQKWAKDMSEFLSKLNNKVNEEGGSLSSAKQTYYRKQYRQILQNANDECPVPQTERKKGQPGRLKKSKSRNLLERLDNHQAEVYRFMQTRFVPFTNNQGENDLRMTKVQQKISGCFRSIDGAYIFCRIRAYLITCRKHDISATDALNTLFKGKLPGFVYKE